MRTLLVRISTTLIATIVALMLFGLLTFLLGAVKNIPATLPNVETLANRQASTLAAPARRAISIPYGISDVITISADGGQLLATGHAVCWDEGQMFDLQVRVAQSTTNAFAVGHSVDICANGERQMWDATAAAQSIAVFEAGNARACAEATEFAQHGIADEYHWCKDIELTTVE